MMKHAQQPLRPPVSIQDLMTVTDGDADTVAIPVSSNLYPDLVILVDAADAERVGQRRWFVHRRSHTFYAYTGTRTVDGKRSSLLLHRFVLGVGPGERVDHQNGNGLDCRRSNLRIASQQLNLRNRTRMGSNRSGFKGVTNQRPPKRRPWRAGIMVNGKRINLGTFDDIHEAARAYDAKAREIFGEFACVNFPRPGERSALTGEIA